MAVFLSPAVFPREIDLSALPSNQGPLVPAFIGTAQKGPLNEPRFITNSQQFVDTFGEPFQESFLGYSVISYLEEGESCWVLRVGVECEEGQVSGLADICIDASGSREAGWGRIPLFTGIDFGKICLRVPSTDTPYEFHTDAVFDIDYTDIAVSGSDGPTSATLSFTGAGLSDTYTGAIDDSYLVLVTGGPTTSGSTMDGARYEVTRQSDGSVIGTGTVVESATLGTSEPITVGAGDDATGLVFAIVVTGSSPLEENDSFSFQVRPDNRSFSFSVDGGSDVLHTFADGTSYTDPATFVDDFNTLVGASFDYTAVYDGTVLCVRTNTAGERIQLVDTEAFALEVGVQKWAYDIPRSHLIGNDIGPFNINSGNNRVNILVLTDEESVETEVTIGVGATQTVAQVASQLDLGGIVSGERFWQSFALQITDDDDALVIETTADHRFDQLKMQVDFSHIKTLRFAEEVEIPFPYTRPFRGFSDSRVVLPESSTLDPAIPLSCELDSSSDECALDTSYYAGIVGFLVASSPGTWLEGWSASLSVDSAAEAGSDLFQLDIVDNQGVTQESIDRISFDPSSDRYIANLLNPGTTGGGVNGNAFVHFEERPSFLANDPDDASTFEIRIPAPVTNKAFDGTANGIPLDPTLSAELDRFIIGNQASGDGIFTFSNPETFDINMLVIPGVSSGAVIAQGLQLCESRGDCIYLIDPPFGLRSSQVVDWHNGLLFSDLTTALNSSYGALYHSWVKISDQFAGNTIFVPPSGHVSAVYARTARVGEQWFAPAGLRRGQLRTALDVEFNPTMGERDLMYGFNNAVNPIVDFPQEGIHVFGQRTLQRADTALDRVNVRMLLIFLKKNIIPLLRNFIFEINDVVTRRFVTTSLESFLSDILARRGLQSFKVICDETNNTPERIDRNELHVAILIKPPRVAEFIVLNLAILRSDASFSAEEVLRAAGVVNPGGNV